MKVSAVGFLFQDKIKSKNLHGKNYTCIIHKVNSDGDYNRNVISSPLIKQSRLDVISPETAKLDVLNSLLSISDKNNPSKFIGATIKDGVKETEIHSIFSDKLFAVRTRDDYGRNHFRILTKDKAQDVLANNLYISA